MHYILAIDQGTSSSRCIIYDRQANAVAMAQQEFTQLFPQPGWVEHDPEEIWRTQAAVCRQAMAQLQLRPEDIAAIGIANQRETTIVWDRLTGKPVYNAIVWQDRRTAEDCAKLKATGWETAIQAKTGLVIDAYFSASKIRWILANVPDARVKAERGELAFGTVDTWLAWKLSGGALHITDVSNASRTMLFNIETMLWDEELLELFAIPTSILPAVKSSSEIYGKTRNADVGPGIPIAALAGDQQAGLFGQMCVAPGMAKCTYGTGAFLMMNSGTKRLASRHGLLTTTAWQIGNDITYALEGSVFVSGAAIQWLRDGLQLFERAADCETLAGSVADSGGVCFVPALAGLGAPHWDPHARGAIFGITRGTTRAHIARAALESIALQVNELLQTMAADSGEPIRQLRIDGGAAANNLLMQLQADIAGIDVIRPAHLETTALGAAYLAGLAVGFWNMEDLHEKWRIERTFCSAAPPEQINLLQRQWQKAVARTKGWMQ